METLYRDLTLDRKGMNTEARIVPASLSSEVEVPRMFGREVLEHTPDAVNLERAAEGLPLLFGHDHAQPIGVVENLRFDGDRLRGDLRFSNNSRASEVWTDVRDGFLKNISIGYRVNKFEESARDDVVRVTDWELLEASVVTVPADATVGINRAAETTEAPAMGETTETRTEAGKPAGDPGVNVVDYQAARDAAQAAGIVEGQRAERKRVDEIERVFAFERYQAAEFQGLKAECIRKGSSVEDTRAALLDLVGQGTEPLASDSRQDVGGYVAGGSGETELEKVSRGIELALAVRVGAETDADKVREARDNEFGGMPAYELARHYLNKRGVKTAGMNRDMLVKAALATRAPGIGHSTGDFPAILENVANKSMMLGFTETPETWREIARVISVPDFKQASLVGTGEFPDLLEVPEGGEFKHGAMADRKEVIQVDTFGRLFSITRQALTNDDLSSLADIPRKMGRAAARKPGDVVYSVLTTNAALNQDSTDLFHADHSNLVASGSGAAPSVATLEAAEAAMALQTDQSSNANGSNIQMQNLIVPVALKATARTLIASQYNSAQGAGALNPNPFHMALNVVADPRLDANSTVNWFVSANPNLVDTIVCAFLDNNENPYLEQQSGWTVDGVEYKVRLDVAAAAAGYQGLYMNFGS